MLSFGTSFSLIVLLVCDLCKYYLIDNGLADVVIADLIWIVYSVFWHLSVVTAGSLLALEVIFRTFEENSILFIIPFRSAKGKQTKLLVNKIHE